MTLYRIAILGAIVTCALSYRILADQTAEADGPQFTASGELLRPGGYREWVWLSSGLGMAYGPNASEASDPPFDNVFAQPAAYRSFLKTGTWPEGTVLVLEIRASVSKGSINRAGHFQGEFRRIEAEVKQGGKWTFYAFEAQRPSGARIPESASCYSCHSTHGAVDNTFVQFYPTLSEVARSKGTFRQPPEN